MKRDQELGLFDPEKIRVQEDFITALLKMRMGVDV